MAKLASMTKKTLWEIFCFSTFHISILQNADYALNYLLSQEGDLIFLVDFSDIHPIMFPKKNIIDKNSMKLSNGIKILWEGIYKSLNYHPKNDLGFTLAITPGTELEIYESLRHCECRIERQIEKYIPVSLLDKTDTKDLCAYLLKNFNNESDIIENLKEIIGNKSLNRRLFDPASTILELFESNILTQLSEEILPIELIDEISTCSINNEIEKPLKEFFDEHPRYNETGKDDYITDIRHNKFHDSIDICNLKLSYNLLSICSEKYKNIYTPFITQTDRVIVAGKKLRRIKGQYVAYKSLVPLYIATGIVRYGKSNIKNFITKNISTLRMLKNELQKHPEIQHLQKITYKERANYLSSQQDRVDLSINAFDLFKDFFDNVYGHINNSFKEEYNNSNDSPKEIDTLFDLVSLIKDRSKLAKVTVQEVKNYISPSSNDFFSAFIPKDEYADELCNWLND